MSADSAKTDFDARCNIIEEAYEFMLAYASQGLALKKKAAAAGRPANT